MKWCGYATLSYLLAVYHHACVFGASELCNLEREFDHGYFLTLSSFYSVKRSSLYSCAGMCKSMRFCKSINFHLQQKQCFLNFQNAKGVRKTLLVEDPLFAYSDKSWWSKEIAGPCANKWCKLSKPCTVGRTGKPMCGTLFFQDFDAEIEYEYVSVNKTWNDAKRYCEVRGSHLAKVDTVETVHFLQDFAIRAELNETEIFLGGSAEDNILTTDWRWTDGTPLHNLTLMGDLQPNIGTCLSVRFAVGFDNPSCLIRRAFICEKIM